MMRFISNANGVGKSMVPTFSDAATGRKSYMAWVTQHRK